MDTLYTIGFREMSGLNSFKNFLKFDHWLQRYCILSAGVFYFEPPGILSNDQQRVYYTAKYIKNSNDNEN